MLSQEVHQRQRQALIEGTVKSVVQYGMRDTSARTIGALSGVNEVYIYHYFENMDDLISKTFDMADDGFLSVILESFPVMSYETLGFDKRCRELFHSCWQYIMDHKDWLLFYINYYYSAMFQRLSYEKHMKRYEIMLEKLKPACHPNAVVQTVLHHILDTLLNQARNQIMHPQDEAQAENDAFHLVLSVVKGGRGIEDPEEE